MPALYNQSEPQCIEIPSVESVKGNGPKMLDWYNFNTCMLPCCSRMQTTASTQQSTKTRSDPQRRHPRMGREESLQVGRVESNPLEVEIPPTGAYIRMVNSLALH